MNSKIKNKYSFFVLPLLLFFVSCAAQNNISNILAAPKSLSIDKTNNRLFIVDAQNNNLSLIDLTTNSVVTGQPLLNQNSAIQIPQLPQDIAATDIGNGVTRLFIIGNGPLPRNQITVLDYGVNGLLQPASFSPLVVGTNAAADQSDILGGLAIDVTTGTLFVSNTTDSLIRAYDIKNGTEKNGSPLTVNSTPQGIGINSTIHRLFVSSLNGNSISVIDTQNLLLAPVSLNVNSKTSDLASSTNANGTALFLIDPILNQILVFNFNVTTPNLSTLIGTAIVPPAPPGTPIDTNTVITGSVAQVAAANLPDGEIVGTITQSTGDLAVVDVSSNLSSYSALRVSVLSGLGAYGIEILTDNAGNGSIAYFVSVGAGALSLVNVVTNQFTGQVL